VGLPVRALAFGLGHGGFLKALPLDGTLGSGGTFFFGKSLNVIPMKNSKLVEEAKLKPSRIYRRPHEVLRDRRLNDIDRLEILGAWERDESASPECAHEIRQAYAEVEARLPEKRAAE
jgi:hypothetical protein